MAKKKIKKNQCRCPEPEPSKDEKDCFRCMGKDPKKVEAPKKKKRKSKNVL